ncbi:MAG: hypothetical protein JRD05_02890 [Deltaproteobacteria bacterium]|nr:hypothetical protein [Deltaproteobacteria bacterium]
MGCIKCEVIFSRALSKNAHIPPLKISGIKRRSGFSGTRQYIQYVEFLKNRYNAVDETFYDAINKWKIGNTHQMDDRSYIMEGEEESIRLDLKTDPKIIEEPAI